MSTEILTHYQKKRKSAQRVYLQSKKVHHNALLRKLFARFKAKSNYSLTDSNQNAPRDKMVDFFKTKL